VVDYSAGQSVSVRCLLDARGRGRALSEIPSPVQRDRDLDFDVVIARVEQRITAPHSGRVADRTATIASPFMSSRLWSSTSHSVSV
jgi:hypothetical protein